MKSIYAQGPLELWEAKLERMTRDGLLVLVRRLLRVVCFDCKLLLGIIAVANREGRCIAEMRRVDQFLADPFGETAKSIRRKESANRSARRRNHNAR